MNKKTGNIFLDFLPSIDLHGFDVATAKYETKKFIDESFILRNEKIVIIHGIGTHVVRKSVHEVLSHDKRVIRYNVDNFNNGITVIVLKI